MRLARTKDDLLRWASSLRPRDATWSTFEIPSELLGTSLDGVQPSQLLLLASNAAPNLLALVRSALVTRPFAPELVDYLRSGWLPPGPLPRLSPSALALVEPLALGRPGEVCQHGLHPSPLTKLARLVLAANNAYPPQVLLSAARAAYSRPEGGKRGYHAHDAVAAMLACPAIDTEESHGLMGELLSHTSRDRGWRSRRKTHQLFRWAVQHGYMPAPVTQ